MNFPHFLEMLEFDYGKSVKCWKFIALKMLEIKSQHLTFELDLRTIIGSKVGRSLFMYLLIHGTPNGF